MPIPILVGNNFAAVVVTGTLLFVLAAVLFAFSMLYMWERRAREMWTKAEMAQAKKRKGNMSKTVQHDNSDDTDSDGSPDLAQKKCDLETEARTGDGASTLSMNEEDGGLPKQSSFDAGMDIGTDLVISLQPEDMCDSRPASGAVGDTLEARNNVGRKDIRVHPSTDV